MLRKFFTRLWPKQKGLTRVLGELETEIMEITWGKGRATVRNVYEELLSQREIAYTTVMTIMTRLADKGLLTKEKEGQAYIYTPVCSQEEFTQTLVGEIIDGLLADYEEEAFAHFLGRLKDEDENKLEELAELLEQKLEAGEKSHD